MIPEVFRILDIKSPPLTITIHHVFGSRITDRTYLEVQWMRVLVPVQGTHLGSLVREDSTCQRATKLMNHNYRAQLELVLYNKRSHCKRSPHTTTREQPLLAATRKSLWNNEDPVQP